VQNTNGAVRQLAAADEYAIGYISLGLVDGAHGLDPVKALAIDGVDASPENVFNGNYGLFRPFLFVTNDEPTQAALDFIDYVLSEEGQRLLEEEGLISVLDGGQTDEEV
jgi:phosphate transport system substrate-binding protein